MPDRNELIENICEHFSSFLTTNSRQNVALITGETGIGKSYFFEVLKNKLERIPFTSVTTSAECVPNSESSSLYTWKKLITRLMSEDNHRRPQTKEIVIEVSRSFAKYVPVIGNILSGVIEAGINIRGLEKIGTIPGTKNLSNSMQQHVFQQIINFLSALSDKIPVILMIDNFNWADESSASLLYACASQLKDKRVFFIIAYRSEEILSSNERYNNPISKIITELNNSWLLIKYPLPDLSESEINTILKNSYTFYEDNSEFEIWLKKVSRGNPLYILQFLKMLEENGYIVNDGDIIEGYNHLEAPATYTDLINERKARMDVETLELLEYASVEGEKFSHLMLSHIINELPSLALFTTPLALFRKLRKIENEYNVIKDIGRTKLYFTETSTYEFTHIIMQKILYDSLNNEEKLFVHKILFEKIKKEWKSPLRKEDNLSRVASCLVFHAHEPDEFLFAAEVLLESAKENWKVYSKAETLKNVEDSLKLIQKSLVLDSKNFEKAKILKAECFKLEGQVYKLLSEHEKALKFFDQSISIFKETNDLKNLANLLNSKAEVYFDRSEFDESIFFLEDALQICETINYDECKIKSLNNLAKIYGIKGSLEKAMETLNSCFELNKTSNMKVEYCTTLLCLGNIYFDWGDYSKALEYYKKGFEISDENNLEIVKNNFLYLLGNIYVYSNYYEKALEYYERFFEQSKRIGDIFNEALALDAMGTVLTIKKNYDYAKTKFEESLERNKFINSSYIESAAILHLGRIFFEIGDFERSISYLQRAYNISEIADIKITQIDCLIYLAKVYHSKGVFAQSEVYINKAKHLNQASRNNRQEIEIDEILTLLDIY